MRNNITTSISRVSALLILLTGTLCLHSCKSYHHEEARQGNTIYFHNDVFGLAANAEPGIEDTTEAFDTLTNTTKLIITRKDTILSTINGRELYRSTEVDRKPIFTGYHKNVYEIIFKALATELDKLPDGKYLVNINDVVVSRDGDLAYCHLDKYLITPDTLFGSSRNAAAITETQQNTLYQLALDELEQRHVIAPAMRNNEPVDYIINNTGFQRVITVQSHIAILEPVKEWTNVSE